MRLKNLAAAAVSAVITLSTLGAFPIASAETTTETVTYSVSYDLSDESMVIEDVTLYEATELANGEVFTVADGEITKEGYNLTGWTYDDVFLYEGGDGFVMPAYDIVLKPVFRKQVSDVYYSVTYYAEVDGEVLDTEDLCITKKVPGSYISISPQAFTRTGYIQTGWTDGVYEYDGYQKIIMPEHDVYLEPVWKKELNVIYDAGTDDRIIGNRSYVFPKLEGSPFELANASRLSRQGFKIAGWICELDGQEYKPLAEYVMPSTDVIFTAIWEPITYNVVFKVNNGTSELIKIAAETDSAIIAPECTATYDGYEFAGWSYEDVIYKPGEEFIVPGALPGLGIMLTGVWVEESADEQTTYDVFSLIEARQAYVDGEAAAEEVTAIADHLMGR